MTTRRRLPVDLGVTWESRATACAASPVVLVSLVRGPFTTEDEATARGLCRTVAKRMRTSARTAHQPGSISPRAIDMRPDVVAAW